MTGTQLIGFSLGLMGEPVERSADYAGYSIMAINILLAECFEVNNFILESIQKPPLVVMPQIIELTEDIPYEDKLVITCLAYGLAAKLILEDNDMNKFNYFNQMYIEAQNSSCKAFSHKIEDVYGGDGA